MLGEGRGEPANKKSKKKPEKAQGKRGIERTLDRAGALIFHHCEVS